MRTRAIPQPAQSAEKEIRSRLAYHYRAEELRTQPISNQSHTFSRPSTSTGLDRNGDTYSVPYGAPAWAIVGGRAHWRLGAGSAVDDVSADFHLPPSSGLLVFGDVVLRSDAQGHVLVCIGEGGDPGLQVERGSTDWRVAMHDGVQTHHSGGAIGAQVGDRLRFGVVLDPDLGTVEFRTRLNESAWVVHASAAVAIPAAWDAATIRLGSSDGSSQEESDYRRLKVYPFHPDYDPEDLELWI